MKLLDNFKISMLGLLRQKTRTFLTGFAVFIGVFIIIFLVSLAFGANDLIISQITNSFDVKAIIVTKPDTLSFNFVNATAEEKDEAEVTIINQKILDDINNLEHIEAVEPIMMIMGKTFEFQDKNFDSRVIANAPGAGWNLKSDDKMVNEIVAGRIDNIQQGELILNISVADAYDKDPRELVGKTVILSDTGGIYGTGRPLPPKEYLVVGVLDYDDETLFVTSVNNAIDEVVEKYGYNDRAEYIETAGFTYLFAQSTDEQYTQDVAKQIEEMGLEAQTLKDILDLFNTFFYIVPIIFSIVGIIAVIIASIGIINTMIMSVYERTKEIGVMKAVGAKNIHIMQIFIMEAGLMGLLSGAIGVIMSMGAITLTEKILIDYVLPKLKVEEITNIFSTPFWLIWITIIFSAIIGILAGLYPAIRASRLDPVKSLRYE